MHTIDIIFLIGGAVLVILGLRRGLIRELFRITALVVGFIVAFLYYQDLLPLFHFVKNPTIATALGFIILYCAAALAILGIGWLVRKIVHLTPLGVVDHFLGGTIGLGKAVLLAWIVCLSLSTWPTFRERSSLGESKVYQAYRHLPDPLSLAGITAIRDSIRSQPLFEATGRAIAAGQQAVGITRHVDSLKNLLPGSR